MKDSRGWYSVIGIAALVVGSYLILTERKSDPVVTPEPTVEGRTVRQWQEFAKNANDPDRCKAVQSLAKLQPQSKDALPAIFEIFQKEKVGWVAIDMIHTLQWITPASEDMASAVAYVMTQHSGNTGVINAALDALGAFGSVSAKQTAFLSGALFDKNYRSKVTQVFIKIGPGAEAALPNLNTLLVKHNLTAQEAVDALYAIEVVKPSTLDASALAYAQAAVATGDAHRKFAAAQALRTLKTSGKAAASVITTDSLALLNRPGHERVGVAILGALAEKAGGDASQALIDLIVRLPKPGANIQPDPFTGGVLGAPSNTELLLKEAIAAVRSVDSAMVVKKLVPRMIQDLNAGNSAEVRGKAALVLGWIGPDAKDALPALQKAANDGIWLAQAAISLIRDSR